MVTDPWGNQVVMGNQDEEETIVATLSEMVTEN